MGGEIDIESIPGQGTTVTFTTHLSRSDKAVEHQDNADIRGLKILYIEENKTLQEVTATQLSAWKTDYHITHSASQGLKMMDSAFKAGHPFQVAIFDTALSDMDGLSLAKAIKNNPSLEKTALVMIASVGRRGDARHYHDNGFTAYFTKPMRQSDLQDCLIQIAVNLKQNRSSQDLITRHSISEQKRSKFVLLLVEENPINQKVTLSMLKRLGFRADVASDGYTAIKALENACYDLIFLDAHMREMDGYETARIIRDKRSNVIDHQVPLVMMTNRSPDADQQIESFGINDFIPKPVSPETLSGVLKKWLANKKASTTKNIYVLIVDDNPINRKVVAGTCKRLNWQSDTANDGRQAVQLLEQKEYDLVLMDCQMPEMDGYEATSIIRDTASKVKNHDIPVIAVTASSGEENRKRCLDAGMDDFITKPVKLPILKDTVLNLLDRSGSA